MTMAEHEIVCMYFRIPTTAQHTMETFVENIAAFGCRVLTGSERTFYRILATVPSDGLQYVIDQSPVPLNLVYSDQAITILSGNRKKEELYAA